MNEQTWTERWSSMLAKLLWWRLEYSSTVSEPCLGVSGSPVGVLLLRSGPLTTAAMLPTHIVFVAPCALTKGRRKMRLWKHKWPVLCITKCRTVDVYFNKELSIAGSNFWPSSMTGFTGILWNLYSLVCSLRPPLKCNIPHNSIQATPLDSFIHYAALCDVLGLLRDRNIHTLLMVKTPELWREKQEANSLTSGVKSARETAACPIISQH